MMLNLRTIVCVCVISQCVNGIMFHLLPNTQKCLREELRAHQLIVGEYEVQPINGQRVEYVVRDTKGAILSQNTDVQSKGKFSAVVENHDFIEVCFKSTLPPQIVGEPQEVSYVAKRDYEGKPKDSLADALKMKPMEVELKNLESLSESIVDDFNDMRVRGMQMSDTNESTNSRVLYLSIFSMCCLLCLSVWQVLYLRKFFKTRKLIE